MESTNTHLTIIKRSFPQHAERIERLYNANKDFRTLCEDYYLCIESARKAQQDFSQDQERLTEYNQVKEELENELLSFLRKTS